MSSNANLGAQSPVSSTASGSNVNSTPTPTPQRNSVFEMKNVVYDTYQFDKISPQMAFHALAGDSVQFRSKPTMRSYTLAAPMLTDAHLHNGFFSVPKASLLPNTYDLLKVPPKIGDDIDYKANTLLHLHNLFLVPYNFFKGFSQWDRPSYGSGSVPETSDNASCRCLATALRCFGVFSDFFSESSLFRRCDIATYSHDDFRRRLYSSRQDDSNYFYLAAYLYGKTSLGYDSSSAAAYATSVVDSVGSIDDYLEYLIPKLWTHAHISYTKSYGSDSSTESITRNIVLTENDITTFNPSEWRDLLSDILYYDCSITSFGFTRAEWLISLADSFANTEDYPSQSFGTPYLACLWPLFTFTSSSAATGTSTMYNNSIVNLAPIYAYQFAASQFFTNDNVDEVNTAEKWLGLIRYYLYDLIDFQQSNGSATFSTYPTFSLNNQTYQYDVLSYKVLEEFLSALNTYSWADLLDDMTASNIGTVEKTVWALLLELFGHKRSLLYSNYFLDSKTAPLAAIDVRSQSASTLSDNSTLATIRSLIITKYANAVNNMPNKVKQFCNKMFGVTPLEVPSCPTFIGEVSAPLTSSETVNTADNQGDITSQLFGNGGEASFYATFTDDSIVLNLFWFDCPRALLDYTSRHAFHYDRYDDYQPMLENIGDQSIYRSELFPQVVVTPNNTPSSYGYIGRYSEYKQLVSAARGAFGSYSPALKKWAYIYAPRLVRDTFINEDAIRNENSDFDAFYKSLTHFQGGNYFHFIGMVQNEYIASRNMSYYAPLLF